MFVGHTKRVRCLSVSATGETLVTGSDDCTCRIWEVDTGRCLRMVTLPAIVTKVAWCPNATVPIVLAVAGYDAYIIGTQTGGVHEENPLPGADVVR